MPILNYTTRIEVVTTAAEIMKILSQAGARKVVLDFDQGGEPAALTFVLDWQGLQTAYALPARHEGVLRVLKQDKVPAKFQTSEQARRVTWRILRDWVDAQMAIVRAEVASLPEVFLPYAVTGDGQTLYERVTNQTEAARLLGGPQ